MATTTIVITSTTNAGEASDTVQSLTVGGTAYGSLTAAQVADAYRLMELSLPMLLRDKVAASPGGLHGRGSH
jgi:hypothetical protein